jgi:hypothetical protein
MTEKMEKIVFHGSPKEFDSKEAVPRRNIRTRDEMVIFDQESFHATPEEWIALAYTYSPKKIVLGDIHTHYNMGVDLYSTQQIVTIMGVGSLEESLKAMYGDGGYLYHFSNGDFIYKEGLGSQEVIAEKPTMPVTMERVEDPVSRMKALGVTFSFIDLALPENAGWR